MAPQLLHLCILALATMSSTLAAAIENSAEGIAARAADYNPPPPYHPPSTTCIPTYTLSYSTTTLSLPVTKTYTSLLTNTAYTYATHIATIPVVKIQTQTYTYTVLSTSIGTSTRTAYEYSTSVATIPVVATVTSLATATGLSATTKVATVKVGTSQCAAVSTTSTKKMPGYTPKATPTPTPVHY